MIGRETPAPLDFQRFTVSCAAMAVQARRERAFQMKSAGRTSLPWLGASDLVVSAPFDARGFTGAFMAAEPAQFPATLLGFGSQLACLTARAKKNGRAVYVCGAPEIFSAASARREIARLHGERSDRRLLHFRSGPARYARALRGMENVYFAAEEALVRATSASLNPYAANDCLPPVFDRIAVWEGISVMPKRLAGTSLPALPCDMDLATVDLSELPEQRSKDRDVQNCNTSLVNFADDAWRRTTASMAAREEWPAQSPYFFDPSSRVILLPWNLCNPAAIAPIIVQQVARHQIPLASQLSLLVCPFNITCRRGEDIVRLVAGVREMLEGNALLQQLWLGALSPQHVITMDRPLVAWLDGQDPDVVWTNRRLQALGIDRTLIGRADWLPSSAPIEVTCEHANNQYSSIDVHDEFGRRNFIVATPSPAQLSGWLEQEADRLRARSASSMANQQKARTAQ